MSGRFFWSILLIVAGVLFLLDNLGMLPGNAWGYIWPLFLIALGVSMLWGRRFGGRLETVNESLPLEGATHSRITLRHGAGRLNISATANPHMLCTGSFDGGVDKRVQRRGDHLDVALAVPENNWMPWGGPWGTHGLQWNVGLNPTIPLALELETGASESHIDLSALKVSELSLKTGASATELTMPAQAGQTRARVESGAASVKIAIPQGVAARIHGAMGLGALNVEPSRFPRRNGGYESPDFETATNRVELEVEGGVGAVTIR